MKRLFCVFVLLMTCTAAFGDELPTLKRVVTEARFAQADEYGCAAIDAAGIVPEGEVKRVAPKRVRVMMDPTCEEECDRIYLECIDRCDPRGDSCARCVDDYNTCYQYCQ